MSDEDEADSTSSSSSSADDGRVSESDDEEDVYSCGAGLGLDYDPWAIAVEAKRYKVIGGGLVPGASNLKPKRPARESRLRPRLKKSVSFCSGDCLEAIRDISPRPDSPLSEELEPCDPDRLIEEVAAEAKSDAVVAASQRKASQASRGSISGNTGINNFGALHRAATRSSLNKISTTNKADRPNAARPNRHGRGTKSPVASQRNPTKPNQATTQHNHKTGASAKDIVTRTRVRGAATFGDRSSITYSSSRGSRARSSSAKPMLSADAKNILGPGGPFRFDSDAMMMSFSLGAARMHSSPYRHGSAPPGRRTEPSPDFTKEFRDLRLGAGYTDISDLRIDTRASPSAAAPGPAHKKVYAWNLANGTLPGASHLITPCISQLWDSAKTSVPTSGSGIR